MRLPVVRRSSHDRVTRERDDQIASLTHLAEARRVEIEQLRSELARYRELRVAQLNKQSLRTKAASTYQPPAIPIVLGIDVEPDRRVVDLADPSWRGATESFELIEELRRRILDMFGVALRVTWFPRADPQVEKANGKATWALEQFAAQWTASKTAGDEIGLHMHPWKWDGAGWSQDHGNDEWVIHCLRASLAAFRDVFGETPAAYRGGDRYLSNAVADELERQGVKIDLTLERMPGVERLVESERGTGQIPDGSMVSQQAFRRALSDFRIGDAQRKDGLAMMPLTAYSGGTLVPWTSNIDFEEELDAVFASQPTNLTHLAFVARSDVALAIQRDDFVANVFSLARRVNEGRAKFMTASQAWAEIASRSSAVHGE